MFAPWRLMVIVFGSLTTQGPAGAFGVPEVTVPGTAPRQVPLLWNVALTLKLLADALHVVEATGIVHCAKFSAVDWAAPSVWVSGKKAITPLMSIMPSALAS